ncbi:diacylglycerol/lipid kinase family protein [Vagococcus fluvialis]|uniref:diacylglycerol/lipid kinase family protein n=1 Tax=Vagococcus fluvialis TaxID=2738 RepID=UPI003B59A2A2
MKNLTLHIIVNPQAGSGNAKKTLGIAQQFLDTHHIKYKIYVTDYPGHENKITQKLMHSVLVPWVEGTPLSALLLVIGGDGTLHEVTNTLHEQIDIPIAYLPAGSGNDFARGLSLTRKTELDLKRLLAVKEPTKIQLIATTFENQGTPQLVLNNIGIGLDAHIVSTANQSKTKEWLNKIHLGSLAYLFSVFSVLSKQKAFPVSFETPEGNKYFENAYLCSITNHPYFGGGIAIDPTASIQKNEMNVVLLEKVNLFLIFYLVGRLLSKKHLSSKYIHHFTTQELTVTSQSSEYCQTDGEIVGKSAQKIKCRMTSRLFWV